MEGNVVSQALGLTQKMKLFLFNNNLMVKNN